MSAYVYVYVFTHVHTFEFMYTCVYISVCELVCVRGFQHCVWTLWISCIVVESSRGRPFQNCVLLNLIEAPTVPSPTFTLGLVRAVRIPRQPQSCQWDDAKPNGYQRRWLWCGVPLDSVKWRPLDCVDSRERKMFRPIWNVHRAWPDLWNLKDFGSFQFCTDLGNGRRIL